MQKRMKEYLNELRKQQRRRRKAAIAAVLLIVLVVGTVAGGLTGSGVANTEGNFETEDDSVIMATADENDTQENSLAVETMTQSSADVDQNSADTSETEEFADEEESGGTADKTEAVNEINDLVPSQSENDVDKTASETGENQLKPENAAGEEEVKLTEEEPENAAGEEEVELTEEESENVVDEEEAELTEERLENAADEEKIELTEEEPENAADEEEAELTEEELEALYEQLIAFEELPEDEVGAVMYPNLMATFSMASRNSWSFDIHYVNQDDSNDVTMKKDFNLKYQMEFHAGADFEEKEVLIRIPRALFTDRDGNAVNANDIAVPKVDSMESDPIRSKSTPFNYYIENEKDGSESLVFFNYEKIKSGTNAAWQVLYKKVKLMLVEDETPWELQAKVEVQVPDPDNEDGKITEPGEDGQPAPLTGRIDSDVELISVEKSYFRDTDKVYTPELYTEGQVRKYIDGDLPEVLLDENGEVDSEKFNRYVYVLWSVTASGKANQPWNLYISERPEVENYVGSSEEEPFVVGYKNNTNSYYKTSIDTRKALEWDYAIKENRTEEWRIRFWVVTAYPKDMVYDDGVLKNNTLVNKIGVSVEGADPSVEDWDGAYMEGSQKWTYREYNWDYTGELLNVNKKSDEVPGDSRDYTGWLKLYESAGGEGYGGIPFHTTGSLNSFKLTHSAGTDDKNTSEYWSYIPGTAGELTTTDDVMYLRLDTTGIEGTCSDYMLTRDDYYYTSVTVTQKDVGFDIWEADDTVAPESMSRYYEVTTDGDGRTTAVKGKDGKTYDKEFNQDVYIWAMFARDENLHDRPANNADGEGDWELVAQIPWNDRGVMTYTFTDEQIGRQPYRVKAVHKTINYRTTCGIDVEVFIKGDSKVEDIIEAYNRSSAANSDVALSMKLEDLSGVWGAKYADGKKESDFWDSGSSSGSFNYENPIYTKSDMGLETISNTLHGGKPYRDNATKLVTGLVGEAHAYKYADTINDADNQRGLVDYYLTAYDGYHMYSQNAMNYLMSTEEGKNLAPGRKEVVFYDLLPYGMRFDYTTPVIAGRLTDLTEDYYQQEDSYWNKSQVKIGPENITVIDDYRETGRTMVAFHITYTGADSTCYEDSNKLWMEGWGVKFRAYFDWKDQDVIRAGSNVFAFMPHPDDPGYQKPLCGKPSQIACDNGSLPSDMAGDTGYYEDLVKADPSDPDKKAGNIDRNPGNDNVANVLYARNVIEDDIATSVQSGIKKLVRADSDHGMFGESAVVEEEKTYIYDITLQASGGSLKDIVIFDRLENAKEDYPGAVEVYEVEKPWKGTFQSVITTGLTQKGITPVVYYQVGSLGDLVDITGLGTSGRTAADYLEEEADKNTDINVNTTGWVTKRAYDETALGDRPAVKAVAVYLSAGSNSSYELKNGDSATFQIRMKAPSLDEIKKQTGISAVDEEEYRNAAYNNPYYYAVLKTAQKDENGQTLPGNPVSVSVNPYGSLEVFKEFDETVPELAASTSFRFRLYWQEGTKETAAAGKLYTLYKKTVKDGATIWEKQTDRLRETDPKGYFTLRKDEKAVFDSNLPNVKDIKLEESSDLFWNEPVITTAKSEDLSISGARGMVVTNSYRPVLYVQKLLEGVPDEANVSSETFKFRLEVLGTDDEYHALADAAYYKTDRTDSRAKITGSGTTSSASADDPGGIFEIRKGEIIALFPGELGTSYRLTELESADWICGEPDNTKYGVIAWHATTVRISNYYRYKDLCLSKKLTHQDPQDCVQEFRFQVFQEDSAGEETPVTTKNQWEMFEAGEDGGIALDEQGSPIPARDRDGNPMAEDKRKGTLGDDGTFTAACAGKVVRISGLKLEGEARDAVYVIREVESGDDYRPVNSACEFVIHHTDESVKGLITNDYLYRPLSVSKTVLYDYDDSDKEALAATRAFTMKVRVDGEPLANRSYILTQNGAEVPATEEAYNEQQGTSAEGKISNIVREGSEGNYVYRYQTNGNGELTLKNGQTAVFENAGKLNQTFTVCEKEDDDFGQITAGESYQSSDEEDIKVGYNAMTYHSTISENNGSVTIVNGSGDYLLLRKEYKGADVEGSHYIEEMAATPWVFEVQFSLEVTDADGNTSFWPREEDCDTDEYGVKFENVSIMDEDGVRSEKWYYDSYKSSIRVGAGTTIIIPLAELQGVESYTLTEDSWFQHQMRDSGNGNGYYQISQSEPANDAGYTGNPKTDQLAVICNEVKYVEPEGGTVYKWMDAASDKVAPETKLVWKLEKYNGTGWEAVSDAEYLSFAGNEVTCDRILRPDDGRIELEMTWDGYFPYIQFIDKNVKPYLNLYEPNEKIKEGVYRLTELQEESAGWGRLAGYGCLDSVLDEDAGYGNAAFGFATDGRTSALYNYSMDVSCDKAVAFVNSNRLDTVEIEKQMSDGSVPTESFTMILEQVVSAVSGSGGTPQYNTEPAGNIPYKLYSSSNPGTPIKVEGVSEFYTGDRGEIYLKAGQYAKLELPDRTQWLVSEQEKDGYSLKTLTPDPGSGKLKKLDDKHMLINPSAEAAPAGLIVESVKGRPAVQGPVQGQKWWRVDKSETLVKEDFKVTGIYSDGSRKELNPGEFELSGEYRKPFNDELWNGYTDSPRIYHMKVSWNEKTTTADISVISPRALDRDMVQNESGRYFAADDTYELLNVKAGDVVIPKYIGERGDGDSIYREYRVTGIGDLRETFEQVTSIKAPYVTTIYDYAFLANFYDSKLESVELPEVTSIESSAFEACNRLTVITLPKATTIGWGAFQNCGNLTSVELPEARTIEDYAFGGCTELRSVKLQNTTTIRDNAFKGCKNLTIEVIAPGNEFLEECIEKQSQYVGTNITWKWAEPQ